MFIKKEEFLDLLITISYPGKKGVLVVATPEEFDAMDKEFEEDYSEKDLDFLTDPKKEPDKGYKQ